MRSSSLVGLLFVVGLAVSACSTAGAADGVVAPTTASGAGAPTVLAGGDWVTYHHDNARTGMAEVPAPDSLRAGWHAKLDGVVFGQPLVVGGRVLAGTEGDTVYALDASSGRVLWSTHLGSPVPQSDLPCGDIDPLGITSTMVFDPASSRVYAVAETTGGMHTLVGIDIADGSVKVRVNVDPPSGDRLANQQRAALTLLNGRIYVAYGGLAGDCANYIGSVVSVTTSGTGMIHYSIPTSREGGMWTPGGATVRGNTLLYSVGNGESENGYDGSDSVIALSADLQRTDFFAPATWADDNNNDLDLGSGTPTLVGNWVLIAGKRGVGYVLRPDHLGGINGQVGQASLCRPFGGSSVSGDVAFLPCPEGPMAVTISASGQPRVKWRSPVTANGAPTVGGGAVWVLNYPVGTLYALSTADGHVLAKTPVGAVPSFASPTLSGSHVYVGTKDGVASVVIG